MTHEEMARELLSSGWRVQPPLTKDNCLHTNRQGSGALNSDGAGYTEWYCQACGKGERREWPAKVVPLTGKWLDL